MKHLKQFHIKVGDIVEVEGVDLTHWSGGDPVFVELMKFISYGKVEIYDKEKLTLIQNTAIAEDDKDQRINTRMIMPVGCIKKIVILKRGGK